MTACLSIVTERGRAARREERYYLNCIRVKLNDD